MSIKDNINMIKCNINNSINIVAATKYVDSTKMLELLAAGINNFGENRVDSFLRKYEELTDKKEIVWHFIGHLQRNKAKDVVNKFDYLHSLDSLLLAEIINKERTTPLKCFIEVHMTNSETKNGVLPEDLSKFINDLKNYPMVKVIGLMTMTEPKMTNEEKQKVFKNLSILAKKNNLDNLSMGMSDDYLLAISENANFIRLGRILFKGEI